LVNQGSEQSKRGTFASNQPWYASCCSRTGLDARAQRAARFRASSMVGQRRPRRQAFGGAGRNHLAQIVAGRAFTHDENGQAGPKTMLAARDAPAQINVHLHAAVGRVCEGKEC
jgi:hypothetical protein